MIETDNLSKYEELLRKWEPELELDRLLEVAPVEFNEDLSD
jgi:hypothetical protein